MFYLALFLIASGVFLVVYSFLSSKGSGQSSSSGYMTPSERPQPVPESYRNFERKEPGTARSEMLRGMEEQMHQVAVDRPTDPHPPTGIVSDELEQVLADENGQNFSRDSKTVDPDISVEARLNAEQVGDVSSEQDVKKVQGDLSGTDCYAVLFEDTSDIIDYETNENTIDPTLNAYKNIKRIGRGRLETAKEGINFYIEKKFFRYDYHRVHDLKYGDNYVALSLKGSSAVKLFLYDDERVKTNINKSYQEYIRRIL